MVNKANLKRLFYRKAPNALRFEHVRFYLEATNDELLEDALEELVKEGFLNVTPQTPPKEYPVIPPSKIYSIKPEHLAKYPIETEISLGNLRMPRLLDGVHNAIGEDVNVVCESFNKITAQRIEELKTASQKQVKELWVGLVTIFGVFVSLFSIINSALKPIYYSSEMDLGARDLFFQSLSNIAPLTLVLGLFLISLRFILKDK